MAAREHNAADAATRKGAEMFWRGRDFSLSQRERAGEREGASPIEYIRQYRAALVKQSVLPHPLSLSRWERETAGGRRPLFLRFLREVSSLYFKERREGCALECGVHAAPMARSQSVLKQPEGCAPFSSLRPLCSFAAN